MDVIDRQYEDSDNQRGRYRRLCEIHLLYPPQKNKLNIQCLYEHNIYPAHTWTSVERWREAARGFSRSLACHLYYRLCIASLFVAVVAMLLFHHLKNGLLLWHDFYLSIKKETRWNFLHGRFSGPSTRLLACQSILLREHSSVNTDDEWLC